MASANHLVLDSSVSNTGNWWDISRFGTDWSLHVVGLEAGGSVQVVASNAASQPANDDTTGVAVQTIGPITGSTNAFWDGPISANWLRVVKVPGVTPTETTVRLFANNAS